MRKNALRYVSAWALAGGLAGGGLVLVTATAASAHFTCADGTTTTVDDPAIACTGHGGIQGAGGPATTAAPDHDHDAEPPTTAKAAPATRTPTTKAAVKGATVTAPPVKASPAYTG